MNDTFCGRVTNVGIGGRFPMAAEANLTTEDKLITGLGVLVHLKKTILIAGTDKGTLIKVGVLFECEKREVLMQVQRELQVV